jgi:hypothetical protein
MGLWKSLRVSRVAHGAALTVVHSACWNNEHEVAGPFCESCSKPWLLFLFLMLVSGICEHCLVL